MLTFGRKTEEPKSVASITAGLSEMVRALRIHEAEQETQSEMLAQQLFEAREEQRRAGEVAHNLEKLLGVE